jgi:hypothetical protein
MVVNIISKSEAPGQLVAPWDVEVGKEYFFSHGANMPMIKAKVTRVNVIPDPLDVNGWRNRVVYDIHLDGQPSFSMFWNPEGELTLETHFNKIYKIINPIFERRKHILAPVTKVGGRRRRQRSTKRRYKRRA